MGEEIKRIMIQLAGPSLNYAGKVAEGYFKVVDDTVFLTDKYGNPVDRYRLTQKLEPGGNARAVACNMLRSRYANSTDFNRALQYPVLKY